MWTLAFGGAAWDAAAAGCPECLKGSSKLVEGWVELLRSFPDEAPTGVRTVSRLTE